MPAIHLNLNVELLSGEIVRGFFLSITLLLGACAPFVPVVDLNSVPPSHKEAAMKIRVFTVESGSYPEVETLLGPVVAYSCKHWLTDPPASKGDALTRLRLEGLKLGANGIIDVTFDTRGTDTWGTNCWETVQASGSAVRFK